MGGLTGALVALGGLVAVRGASHVVAVGTQVARAALCLQDVVCVLTHWAVSWNWGARLGHKLADRCSSAFRVRWAISVATRGAHAAALCAWPDGEEALQTRDQPAALTLMLRQGGRGDLLALDWCCHVGLVVLRQAVWGRSNDCQLSGMDLIANWSVNAAPHCAGCLAAVLALGAWVAECHPFLVLVKTRLAHDRLGVAGCRGVVPLGHKRALHRSCHIRIPALRACCASL